MKATLEKRLQAHSKDTGVPAAELRNMCLRFGLEALDRGDLKVGPTTGDRLPIFLPAPTVELLREICEAAELDDGAEELVGDLIGSMVIDSIKSSERFLEGVPELILDGWVWDSGEERETARAAMLAVVSRWTIGADGEPERKEVGR